MRRSVTLRMLAVPCLLAAPGLAGCNTVSGLGQDIAASGRFIENGAKSTQEAMFGPAEAAETADTGMSPSDIEPAAGGTVIYFDSGSADLDADARRSIVAMANDAMRRGSAKIEVSGYADASGSAVYNRMLSQRRASVVAAALEAHGLGPGSIDVDWHGESEPAVPTADGVSDDRNRRVVMHLSSS